MTRSKHLTLWLSLWLTVLGLNSVLAMVHAGHGHKICPHGEITHEDEDEGQKPAPQKRASQWAGIQATHQHCATSPWSRTLARLSWSPLEMMGEHSVTPYASAPITTAAFSNIALTHQAPKNSPPFA